MSTPRMQAQADAKAAKARAKAMRPWYRKKRTWLLGVVLVIVLLVAINAGGSHSTPGQTGRDVTGIVTGVGTASTVALTTGGSETQHNAVTLPFTHRFAAGASEVGITAQSGSGARNATITCEVKSGSTVETRHTSTGPYAVVSCTWLP